MTTNEFALRDVISRLAYSYGHLDKVDYIVDKGTKFQTLEVLGARIEFDPKQKYFDFGDIRQTSRDYCIKEMKWYDSQSLSIKGYMDDIAIWKQVCDKDGRINSNYGWIIYSEENGYQFANAAKHLKENQFSRRGIMIFNRPSIHKEWDKNGMHDFICSTAYQFFIRNNQLIGIYTWRSEDLIFGLTGSDFFFAATVYDRMYFELVDTYPNLKYGKIIWFCNSLHIYERHWHMLPKLVQWFDDQELL